MERYPRASKEGFIQKDVSKGFPAWLPRVEVAGETTSGRAGSLSAVNDAPAPCSGRNRIDHAARLGVARPDLAPPICAALDLDPSREDPDGAARRRPRRARAPRELALRASSRRRLEGFPHLRPPRRRGRLRDRRALRPARAPCSSRPPELLTRSSSRPTARAHLRRHGPHGQRRHSPPSMPSAPRPAGPSRRPAPGRRSSRDGWPANVHAEHDVRRLAEQGDLWQL